MPFKSHDEYIAAQPTEVRERLVRIQKQVEAKVPEAIRTIGYNMPAYKRERAFFYFASFKKHVGVFPPVTDDLALIKETRKLRGPKGNLSFPHDQDLPLALIGRIAVALEKQYAKK